jgi:light-regulated signal transduction histidine kinase (bacteriophytochrome)
VIGVAFLDEFRRPTEIITHELRQSLASLSLRLDERVMHPLRALAAGTERIAAGELSYQVNLNVADELGYLAEKFNDMAKHLRAAQEKAQQSEQAVRQLNTELEQRVQQRTNELLELNTELEAFSYSVSHDLRAPLRHLIAYAKLLEEQLKPHLDNDSQHYLNALYKAASNMGELVDDLLQFSRVGRNEMNRSRVAMNAIVRDVIDTFKTDIGERQIEWLVDNLPSVYADSGLMRLVWTNLIGNAIKYTSTRAIAKIHIRCADEGNNWNFTIEDNGVGFDMAYLDKLFGVFQRLHSKDEFEGTGIGLANVRRIVLRHGGTVSAYGELDHGARFSFTLPKRSTD